MAREPKLGGAAIVASETRATEKIPEGDLHDVLVVDGPFGWSGVYPLTLAETARDGLCVRHCNLYFVKLTASPALQERAPTVVEKTHYRLADGDRLLRDAEVCTACLNKGCPQNRNARATAEDAPGKLILSL
ncbi:MAG: hypothetical protein FJZ00_02480 [Candidatus Sericytochromatia bacterium]|uniref:Uncharacterized protein n=1 Tax=Candidatus Tanganyikabacteria bacterium TaxID=2961651 RepID=A0A938BI36_9BACT|nr:hypothetical protein [Candidatus Tanganyikabacteria bacterium]